jgi:hypothetical protein
MAGSYSLSLRGCSKVLIILLKRIGFLKTIAFIWISWFISLYGQVLSTINMLQAYPEYNVLGASHWDLIVTTVGVAAIIFIFGIYWCYYIDAFVATMIELCSLSGNESNKPENI